MQQLLLQLRSNTLDRRLDPLSRHYVMLGGKYEHLTLDGKDLRRNGIDIADILDRIAEELEPHAERFVRRPKLDHIAANTKRPASEIHIVPRILNIG